MTTTCKYTSCKRYAELHPNCGRSLGTCTNTARANYLHELVLVRKRSPCNTNITGAELANAAYVDRHYTIDEMQAFLDSLAPGEMKRDFDSEFEELCVK